MAPQTSTPFSRLRRFAPALLRLLLLLPIAFAAACQATLPDAALQTSSPGALPPYTVGPGDKIRVTVYEHENLSGVFSVDDAGRLSLPLIRGVEARGLTLPDLEKTITRRLTESDIVNPKVSADLIELRPFCVLGEVRNPGCFSYVHGLTASKAIALAGGYTHRAVKNRFVITREDGRKVKGNHETWIFRGDLVEVAERYF